MTENEERLIYERERRQRIEKRKQRRRQKTIQMWKRRLVIAALILLAFWIVFGVVRAAKTSHEEEYDLISKKTIKEATKNIVPISKRVYIKPEITEEFLTVNPNSRPGEPLEKVHSVFVHYTANPGTTAMQNRSYFENLGITQETSASAHFVIGYEGEIVQCLPLDEIGYAVKGRNYDSVSIECCYLDESGQFTDATKWSLIKLVAYLMGKYHLSVEDVLRHYDEGGKNCPKYYVENEMYWYELKGEIESYIEQYGRYFGKEEERE